jgi:6-phosphogluconolactonase
MSLTLPRLLDSEQIILHLSGAGKLSVFEQARAGDDVETLPVRAIINQRQTPLSIYWAR